MKHFTNSLTPCAIGIFAAIGTMGASAAPLSPAQALQRAMAAPGMNRVASNIDATPVYTVKSASQAAAYVFNKNGLNGYLILSADDRAVPVLGYSEKGTFDAGQIPDGLQYLLDFYAREIAEAPAREASTTERPQRDEILPMVTTKWDQEAPYNGDCPVYLGYTTMTGCMATSASQVMNYHKWPAVGEGSNTISFAEHDYTVNFAEHPFDWDNMLDVYTDEATEEQKAAVANLMYCVGVGENMVYNLTFSGSYSKNTPMALYTYFKYDKGAHLEYRYFYTLLDWENMVYDELSSNGPVIYDGVSPQIGHSFVLDGYRDGYFHVNWGWSGVSDGYFLLSALDPNEQGIGGGIDGYNENQVFVRGLKKAEGDSPYYYQLGQLGCFLPARENPALGSSVRFQASGNGIYNFSEQPITWLEVAFECTGADGKVSYIPCTTGDNVASMSGFTSFNTAIPEDLEPGEYTLRFVWRMDNESDNWEYVKTDMTVGKTMKMTVADGRAEFASVAKASLIEAEMPEITTLYRDEYWDMNVTLVNNGDEEFYGGMLMALCQRNTFTPVSQSNYQYLTIPAKGSVEAMFPMDNQVKLGTYTFYVMCEDGTVIRQFDNVKVEATNGINLLEAESPAAYYDLQGRRVSQPSKGLYIKVSGGRAEKISEK